jgi:hypothetical protein
MRVPRQSEFSAAKMGKVLLWVEAHMHAALGGGGGEVPSHAI